MEMNFGWISYLGYGNLLECIFLMFMRSVDFHWFCLGLSCQCLNVMNLCIFQASHVVELWLRDLIAVPTNVQIHRKHTEPRNWINGIWRNDWALWYLIVSVSSEIWVANHFNGLTWHAMETRFPLRMTFHCLFSIVSFNFSSPGISSIFRTTTDFMAI